MRIFRDLISLLMTELRTGCGESQAV